MKTPFVTIKIYTVKYMYQKNIILLLEMYYIDGKHMPSSWTTAKAYGTLIQIFRVFRVFWGTSIEKFMKLLKFKTANRFIQIHRKPTRNWE